MSYANDLLEAQETLARVYRSFKQGPTPQLGKMLRSWQNRVKYLKRCAKKEASK